MNSPPNRTPCHEQQIDRRRHTKTGVSRETWYLLQLWLD